MDFNKIITKSGNYNITVEPNSQKNIIMESSGSDCQDIETSINVMSGGLLKLHILCNSASSVCHSIKIIVGDSCNVLLSVAEINGKKIDVNINIDIVGQGSQLSLPGILMPSYNESFRYNSTINHKVGHCTTNQKVRTIANGNGYGDFFGIIKVERDAQKTETSQISNNILLSENAKIDSKPQLEIYADDVKCTHGSTTGMLDQDAIFYMRSRGISQKSAEKLLLKAFIAEVIDMIDSDEYSNKITSAIDCKLEKNH